LRNDHKRNQNHKALTRAKARHDTARVTCGKN
jgi:hypothetical protein